MHTVTHGQTIIELSNVCFSYNANDYVIKDVSLEVHKGDYVGIIGPNGGGKSTLLKLMLGLLTPQKGVVKLFDTPLQNFRDWSKIGYVPQRTHFDMNFPVSVQEVVAMGRYGKRGLFHFLHKED